MKAALRDAGVEASAVQLVEAHSTGTKSGDRVELDAIAGVFAPSREGGSPRLLVTSTKSVVGHTESVAGLAGTINIVWCLRRGIVPGLRDLKEPLGELQKWEDKGVLEVLRSRRVWTGPDRIALVNSFGFRGANVAVVLGEAPPASQALEPAPTGPPPKHLLQLSARTPEALQELGKNFQDYLELALPQCLKDPSLQSAAGKASVLQTVCGLATARKRHDHRLVAVLTSPESAAAELRQELKALNSKRLLVLMFTGQGLQLQQMGGSLYQRDNEFRHVIKQCAQHLSAKKFDLEEVLYGGQPRWDTVAAQVCIYCVQCALVHTLKAAGVLPDIVCGHSIGEYAAGYAAGAFQLETGLELVWARGSLMQMLPATGAMWAVPLPEHRVRSGIANTGVDVAAVNSDSQGVGWAERQGEGSRSLTLAECRMHRSLAQRLPLLLHRSHSGRLPEEGQGDLGERPGPCG